MFAQLYGTVALLEQEERARIAGLVINKFRGDVEILRPGLAMLEEKTACPFWALCRICTWRSRTRISLSGTAEREPRG